MPDRLFSEPRLAEIYDALDADRSDLVHYLAIVDELGANTVVDIGCGTGTFACLLAARGFDVIGLDPAEASLAVAMKKPGADHVRWHLGNATSVPEHAAELATLTGNVSQVFLTDRDWAEALSAVRKGLAPSGHLVFETRDPARRDWEEWTRDASFRRLDLPGVGVVESWVELTGVDLPLVSFSWTYRFESDGAVLMSDSTLRFRDREEIASSLTTAGFELLDVRDAPDRPGKEFVFVTRVDG